MTQLYTKGTDSWSGTPGERELWPELQEVMTWVEACDLLGKLVKEGFVEHRYISPGDIWGEYRLIDRNWRNESFERPESPCPYAGVTKLALYEVL